MSRLRAQGHQTTRYDNASDPAQSVGRAQSDGCTVFVACGGDGTVSGVAAAAIATGATLGVFPMGTLNHFAGDLGLKDMGVAEEALLSGHTRQVDAASVNGRFFINNSGIGIYPAMVVEREAVRRVGIPKWPAFFVACCKALFRLPRLRLRLEADGKRVEHTTPFLFVGNNVYEPEGLSLGSRARLDAGQLVIFTARHSGPTGLIRIAFRALAGSVRADRDFTEMTAARLTVQTRPPARLHVSCDGELVRMDTPLEYEIRPGALRVLAP